MRIPAVGREPLPIGAYVLGAGQHDEIGPARTLARPDPLQVDTRLQAQGIEVGVVGNTRQRRHLHHERRGVIAALIAGDGVLGVEIEPVQPGQHAEHRFAGLTFQPVQARFEQGDIATKAVDHETRDPCPLRFRE